MSAPGFVPFARKMLGAGRRGFDPVRGELAAVDEGTDSLWPEPLDLPDAGGSLAVYSPTHRWLNALTMGAPVFQADQERLIARLRARGLPVEWLGSVRGIAVPEGRGK